MRSDGAGAAPRTRARGAGDLGACVAALRAVHLADGYPTVWPADPAGWLALGGAGDRAWVVERDGRIAGHVALVRAAAGDVAPALLRRDPGPVAVVSRLFVAPGERGRGLGTLLLARAADAARAQCSRAVLDVVTTDTAAIALYERAGWTFLGTGRQHWAPGVRVTVRGYAAPDGGTPSRPTAPPSTSPPSPPSSPKEHP
ncbi:GNAT family N-acetyltransferase [Streptomyces sp. NPDC088785]|uniref:GNAT family N-acetyltransferase n=1 Tax=Streptomyces sp. NPDC088785 TaxID=3365897 RepID=UPI00380C3AB4